MKKIAAFQVEDGSIFDNANEAHNHEIKKAVIDLCNKLEMPKEFALFISGFVVDTKDKLLNILEKPKL